MARQNRFEQLDAAIQSMLVRRDAPLPGVSESLAPLVEVAEVLRDLPRPSFKARLKSELEEKTAMTIATQKVQPVPAGYHTITPYIVVRQAAELIDYVKQVFGAREDFRSTGSAGGIHCEVQIGESKVMLGGGGAFQGTPMPAAIHLYVEDADAVYQRALQAGGVSLHAMTDHDYGERSGSVLDPFGNHWYIATADGPRYVPEGVQDVNVCLNSLGAPRVIEFMERALGAETVSRHESPAGTVVHARLRIGDSVVEMGEAHGPYQPMPTMFYLYVEDADAMYQRALAAGATSLALPVDQPYGDRNAAVTDPFGNQWYFATHVRDVQM